MALAGEAGELLAELQWLTDDEIARRLADEPAFRARVEGEIADVMIYLTYLANATGSDLLTVADRKVAENETRFPVEAVRGQAVRHTNSPTKPEDA